MSFIISDTMFVFTTLSELCKFYEFSRKKGYSLIGRGLIGIVAIKRKLGAKDRKGYCMVGPSIRALSLKL